jgi:endonuclease/exonuclease/phosphatase family metal-dependent hydrolase
MKIITYNIHYAIGKDEQYDLNRIADATHGAEINPGGSVLTRHPISGRPGNEISARLDYCFLTPELAIRAKSSWVDRDATGSDHQPVWIELDGL